MRGYDTVEYARSRLNETVIRLGNRPVMVLNCTDIGDGNIGIIYNDLQENKSHTAVEHIDKFNLDPVPLGYLNLNKRASYLSRMPMRKDWRQGLRAINLVDEVGYHPNLSMKTVAQVILGNYPKLSSVLDRINSENKPDSMAFDRSFCINNESRIIYKGKFDVGDINIENGAYRLEDRFSWVNEALEESMERSK